MTHKKSQKNKVIAPSHYKTQVNNIYIPIYSADSYPITHQTHDITSMTNVSLCAHPGAQTRTQHARHVPNYNLAPRLPRAVGIPSTEQDIPLCFI